MKNLFKKIAMWFNTCSRKKQAKEYGVPFRKKMWYNLRAMLQSDKLSNHSFIEIFDEKGHYIDCPGIGNEVIYNHHGNKFRYKIIGFKNESRNRDWLYDTDYIMPVCEFIAKI